MPSVCLPCLLLGGLRGARALLSLSTPSIPPSESAPPHLPTRAPTLTASLLSRWANTWLLGGGGVFFRVLQLYGSGMCGGGLRRGFPHGPILCRPVLGGPVGSQRWRQWLAGALQADAARGGGCRASSPGLEEVQDGLGRPVVGIEVSRSSHDNLASGKAEKILSHGHSSSSMWG